MFTGIITQLGKLKSRREAGGDVRLTISAEPDWLAGVAIGDSIAINGVCLTVVEFDDSSFALDVSNETLACTSLGALEDGAALNLEKALRASDPLGGHLVSGHVDAVTEVVGSEPDGRSERLWFAIPPGLAKFIAPKGSICVDGISLTVNEVESERFGVNIIPHTSDVTVAGSYQAGTRVNLEVDLIARYVARVLGHERKGHGDS